MPKLPKEGIPKQDRIWWVSIILLVLAILFYLITDKSPLREIVVILATVFLIGVVAFKFIK